MASINADNGVVSGITGIRTTADNTGNLSLQANGVTLLTVSTNNTVNFSNVTSNGNISFAPGNLNALTLDTNQVISLNGSVEEKVTVSATAATANINFDAVTQNILFYTSNATANTTINIRGSATVPLNNAMSNGQSISLVFMNTQGNTAYYVSGYQIDGTAVTPKWQGNSAPTSGNVRGIDVYSLTAIKTANATFTVLASQTQFA